MRTAGSSKLLIVLTLAGAGGGIWLFNSTSNRLMKTEGLADLETIESRLRDSLLAIDEESLRRMEGSCADLLETQAEDGTWPDIDYGDRSRYPWKPVEHLQRVAIFSQALVTPDSVLNASPSLLEACRKGFSHWVERDYESDNWWYNQIYVPKLIGYILLCLERDLPKEVVDRGLRLMEKGRWRGMTGQNLIWVAGNEILRGCLTTDPALVWTAYDYLYEELRIAEEGQEGIQPDGSFHQHGPYLNSGSYGASFAKDAGRYLAAAWDTSFRPPRPSLEAFLGFLLEGEQWMFTNGIYDYSTWGRAIVRPSEKRAPETFFNESIIQTMNALSALDLPRDRELEDFLARLKHAPDAQPLVGHRHYWKSDYTVHRRPGYMATLRMHSQRTINSECVNGEGGTTHHLADGVTFLYRDGGEYKDVFGVWDWRKLPGVTCVQRPDPLSPEVGLGVRGSTQFVGGVSNGKTGVSAMDLEKDSLNVRKAWFFFDDEIVCLGAGITSSEENSVITSVEQRLLEGAVQIYSGSNISEASGSYSGGADWILHDGVGYGFPGDTRIEVRAGPRSGRWSDIGMGPSDWVTRDTLQIWIDHSEGVRGATYEYRIAPGLTVEEMERRRGLPEKVILSNTSDLQAVYDPVSKTLQSVYYQPGSVKTPGGWNFSLDEPCLFQAVMGATEVEVSVSNPANEPLEVRMKTNLPLGSLRDWERGDRGLRLELPESEEAGSSLTRRFELENP